MPYAADLRTVIRHRDFRILFLTRVSSALSDGMFQVGVAGFVFFSPEQQTSPTKAAAAAAVLLLPYSILGPFAGVFIDRWRRRQILVYAPLIRACCVGVTALLLATGHDGAGFYLAALFVLGVNRFFLSALSAALPLVVGRGELVAANAVSVTSGTFVTFVGAGLGYLLRLIFGADERGTALILLSSAAFYVTAAILARLLDPGRLGPETAPASPPRPPGTVAPLETEVRGLLDGARHVWERRPAAAALGAISAHRFLYGIITIMTVLLFRNTFASSAQAGLSGFALVLVVSGTGYFLAAVVTPLVTERIRKDVWIAIQLVVAAVTVVIFCAPFSELPFVLGAFVLGLVAQGVKISVDTIVQLTVLDAYRGRVFSFYDMLFNAMFVAGFAVAAVLLPTSGKSYPVLAVIGVGYACTGILYLLGVRNSAPVIAVAGERPRPSQL